MKAIQTLICASALLCATFSASAAWPTGAIFDPTDGIVSETEKISVQFTCDEGEVESPMYVMAFMVGGNGFGQDPTMHELVAIGGKLEFNLSEADWGYPYNEEYSVYVGLVICEDDSYTPYETEDGDMLAFETTYQRPVEGAAECVLEYPDARNWSEEGLTFSDFYDDGYCAFYFTKEVSLVGDSFGVVEYYADGDLIYEISIDNSMLNPAPGMDPLSGMYAISVVVKNEDFTASDLSEIRVKLTGVVSEGKPVEVTPISALNNDAEKKAPRKIKSSLEKEMLNNSSTVSVYNMQGMLINDNMSASMVSNLPAGMYIINGKKTIIR